MRTRPPRGDFAALDLPHADISLPMDRKIFQPPQRTRIQARTLEAGEAAEARMADGGKALEKALEATAIDRKALQENIEETAKEHGGKDVTLEEVVKRHPLTGGLSELLAYFVLAEGQERGDAAAEEMHIPFEKGNRKRIAIMNEIRFPFERK